MRLRFLINPRTGEPHVYDHGVTDMDVLDVLEAPMESRPGDRGAMVALGQTRNGQYLRVIYRPEPERASVFVITAFTPGPKSIQALRRRLRRKR
jgi:hypothetical protein